MLPMSLVIYGVVIMELFWILVLVIQRGVVKFSIKVVELSTSTNIVPIGNSMLPEPICETARNCFTGINTNLLDDLIRFF